MTEPSVLASRLRDLIDLVDTEDRLQVRDLQQHIGDLQAERTRFGDLIAEIGRQLRPLARQAVSSPEALAEHQALARRLTILGNTYATAGFDAAMAASRQETPDA